MKCFMVAISFLLYTSRGYCADTAADYSRIRSDSLAKMESPDTPFRYGVGLRVGISDNPNLSYPEWNGGVHISSGQARITGGQLAIQYSHSLELAVGYDQMVTPYRRDDLFNRESSLALNFMYVSPGLYLGKHASSTIDFGVHLDLGVGWAHLKQKDTLWGDSPVPLSNAHAISIRPKLSMSHRVWRRVSFRLESGWLWADIGGVSRPYFENFPGTSEAKPYIHDFRGPFAVAMLFISGPLSAQK